MNTLDVQAVADRYVAQWNEPDPVTRRSRIRELWAQDGIQVLVDPPQEVRDAAANLAIPAPPLEVRGFDALEARVTRAYEMFVAAGEYRFELCGDAQLLLPLVIGLRWSMVSTHSGETVGGGLDVLAVDRDDRIRTDHQFIA